MKLISIKGLVPGSGKTTTLVKTFTKANFKNKIILTPSNKARQVCIQKLIENGYSEIKAKTSVATLKAFKRNFLQHQVVTKYFDMEDLEWKEEYSEKRYITTATKDHTKKGTKVWNIFVDEAAMISTKEFEDLIEHFNIQNLVIDGDANQFAPIANHQVLKDGNNDVVIEWHDEGKIFKPENINKQYLLNKSMRSRDPYLDEVVKLVKEGNIGRVFDFFSRFDNSCIWDEESKNVRLSPEDYYICYTNKMCKKINDSVDEVSKWIVFENDRKMNTYKGEIILKSQLEQLEVKYQEIFKDVEGFEDWKKYHLKPAHAITCHKLQGTTIEHGDIYINVADCLLALKDIADVETRRETFQKFLYIAISRATNLKQVHLLGSTTEHITELVNGMITFSICKDKPGYQPNEYVLSVQQALEDIRIKNGKILEFDPEFNINIQIGEMNLEDQVGERWSADDPELINDILSNLEYTNSELKTQYPEEYAKRISKAKTKYTDEYLLSLSHEELYSKTRNAKIRKRWNELQDQKEFEEKAREKNIADIQNYRKKYNSERTSLQRIKFHKRQ
jgi:hypothetical protein